MSLRFSLPICKIHLMIPASLVLSVLSSLAVLTRRQLVWGESRQLPRDFAELKKQPRWALGVLELCRCCLPSCNCLGSQRLVMGCSKDVLNKHQRMSIWPQASQLLKQHLLCPETVYKKESSSASEAATPPVRTTSQGCTPKPIHFQARLW